MTTKDFLESAPYMIALLGGLLGAIIFLLSKHIRYKKQLDRFYQGVWGNEGVLAGKRTTHYITLNLECSGKRIGGSIVVKALDGISSGNYWFNGSRGLFKTTIELFNFRAGKKVSFGKAGLKRSQGNLEWVVIITVGDFFPKKATLFKRQNE